MTLAELMDVDVTTVTRTPQKFSDSPSAVQVITGEGIRRSGASSIPEALRLAGNLHVAQKVRTRGRSARAVSIRIWPTNFWC
ncbi:MAG TPA: hypothetical protein PLH97_08455 [Verrucomicrobiota bacterium]|nr:hypothetical protein [Verrucomicrobiota bacterium]